MPRRGNINRGTYIPYGTFSDADRELRTAYYYYGYRRDEDLPELPVMEPDDIVEDPSEEYDRKQLAEKVNELIDSLTPREANILRLRFGIGSNYDHTQEELANMFGVTKVRIGQIEAKAIRKLKSPSKRDTLYPFIDPETGYERELRIRQRQNEYKRERLRKQKELEEVERFNERLNYFKKNLKSFIQRFPQWEEHLKESQPDVYEKLRLLITNLHYQEKFNQYEAVQLSTR